ncbi:hypothetical protein [Cryobacterium psychrophilum]|uniref:Uncharacterized protein n=1 Tax=Cryobacterium psychrophilum TaxID=41988 RepID=A0A4Y8KQ73_9MICO|nr:hypothetical protein [Cryobacterium psychrophilum]TFD81054.1 hypothetical protein E3T53_03465 [Cryobacterium psychrophilum]
MAQLRQSAFFEGPRPRFGEAQRGLAMPHGVAGKSKEIKALDDPPIRRRFGDSSRFRSDVDAAPRIKGHPEHGFFVGINPQMMPFLDMIDLRFPGLEARNRTPAADEER